MGASSRSFIRRTPVRLVAWSLLVLCALLDAYVMYTVKEAPRIGARFRTVGGVVKAIDVDPQSDLGRAGLIKGDLLVSFEGEPADPVAFNDDPYNFVTREDHQHFWVQQKHFNELLAKGAITVRFLHHGVERTVTAKIYPLGWSHAWKVSWSLRFVGWTYVILSCLIWVKRQEESSTMNLLVSLGVCIACCTAPSYLFRDFCMPLGRFRVLAAINYLVCFMAIVCLHLAWVVPSPARILQRYPRLKVLPWLMTGVLFVFFLGDYHPFQLHWFYIFSSISLLGLMLFSVIGMLQATDPLLKAQMKWITLGIFAGFFPWVLLSEIPMSLGVEPLPVAYTLLTVVLTPTCLAFAILRYHLLDVEQIFDWVIAHAVILSAFLLIEFSMWRWLGSRYAPQHVNRPLMLSLSMFVVVFLYAPFRTWMLRALARRSGRLHPTLAESLRKLLEYSQETGDPMKALEQTLRWSLNPSSLVWFTNNQGKELLFEQLEQVEEGALGYELGPTCPLEMEMSGWIPIQIGGGLAAIVLHPSGSSSWSRQELRMARTLARSGEPLFEIRRIQREREHSEAAMVRQREELIRELHDGLGSQLFGASLLSNLPQNAPEGVLSKRMTEIHSALGDAMDSLRTGLTVLHSPPGAFGPAVLSSLMRVEKVLDAAGIALKTEIADEATTLQLSSQQIFGVLRAMQESFTNIARHSRAQEASVNIDLNDGVLCIRIEDNGVGFCDCKGNGGHGLASIQNRLHALGGRAEICSSVGKGCCVCLELPIEQENRS